VYDKLHFFNSHGLLVALPLSALDVNISRLPQNYTKTPKTIGEHLLKLRIDLKLTKKAIAERIGVTPPTYGQWENEVYELLYVTRKKIEAAINKTKFKNTSPDGAR
jgi:DNA-binding XRE family transcriptional regulator